MTTPPIIPCDCGSGCDFHATGGECWGDVTAVEDTGDGYIHACHGHRDVLVYEPYIRPPDSAPVNPNEEAPRPPNVVRHKDELIATLEEQIRRLRKENDAFREAQRIQPLNTMPLRGNKAIVYNNSGYAVGWVQIVDPNTVGKPL